MAVIVREISEAYLEPSQISMMKPCDKRVTGF